MNRGGDEVEGEDVGRGENDGEDECPAGDG